MEEVYVNEKSVEQLRNNKWEGGWKEVYKN